MVHRERDRGILHPGQRGMSLSLALCLSARSKLILRLLQFYCEEHVGIGENYARFAFCKDLDTLRRAGERLQRLREYLV